MFAGRNVLVTGASGSFGTAFFKYLLGLNARPKKLICFSRGWLAQKNLRDEIGEHAFVRYFIGDVRDRDRLKRAFKGVDTVIHAAAIKCIDACSYNPSEAMLTNIVGTQNAVDACIDAGVSKSLLISSDKACNPINSYGISKAMAESLWLNANKTAADDRIKFSVCRYGNVCGSAGSIVPVWKKMIERGAEWLPITDERCTRFWWEMDEVMQFVADSMERMQGGELFIPDLPSIRITDLCAAFGMPYKVVGLRQGEKIAEQMDVNSYDSGNNPHFLTVEEIKKTIGV